MTGETQLQGGEVDAEAAADDEAAAYALSEALDDPESKPVTVEDVSDVSAIDTLKDPEHERTEVDRIDPKGAPPDGTTLLDGTEVRYNDLRTKELFALLRILTRGGAFMVGRLDLDPRKGEAAFISDLMALLMFAIPEADEEALEFVRMMVVPVPEKVSDDVPERHRKEAVKEKAKAAQTHLDEQLENPELDDLLGIIEGIIRREAPDIMALGRRLVAMMPKQAEIQQETEARERNRRSRKTGSSEASPEPSTS
jgi:hypothetical protein